ncbi:MAG: ABC transporter ATP-binding protein [Verrucomicrobiales bacterium]|nr:ABC transporter ATP-binding protein [Verrucomicrobiales bacterium]
MVECSNLVFQYPGDSFSLKIADLEIAKSEKVAIIGPSGCGKTTLLQLISGILTPRSGEISVDGQIVSKLSKKERQAFRIQNIGLVPQRFELLDYLTVIENVLLPYRISSSLNLGKDDANRALDLMKRVGIGTYSDRQPEQLSQGERQRTAICRGLITTPKVILADEPTGNLDPENQSKIVDLLLEQADNIGATVIMVTHEPSLLPLFERTIDLLELRSSS